MRLWRIKERLVDAVNTIAEYIGWVLAIMAIIAALMAPAIGLYLWIHPVAAWEKMVFVIVTLIVEFVWFVIIMVILAEVM